MSRVPLSPEWGIWPFPDWKEAGRREVIELGLLENRFLREHKERMFACISFPFWEALLAHAKSSGSLPREGMRPIEVALARQIGRDDSTGYRWLDGTNTAENFFAALVVGIQAELPDVAFPDNVSVVWLALRRSLALVRQFVFGLDFRLITVEEYYCLWWLVRHRQYKAYLAAKNFEVIESVHADVLQMVQKQFKFVDAKIVSLAIDDWSRPYSVFLFGLPDRWESVENDTAAGNSSIPPFTGSR